MTQFQRPIDLALVDAITAAWELNLAPGKKEELLHFLARDVPTIWQGARRATRPGNSNRSRPEKINLRRFLLEFGLHYERAGGRVAGSWARDPARGITGKYAAGLRVLWEALPPPRPAVEAFLRHVKAYPRGWKSHGSPARAAHLLQQYNAWRS